MVAPNTKVSRCSSYLSVFETAVSGIPCNCAVIYYTQALPMRITGTGFGDADPPEPTEFEFELLDRRGRPAPWLESKTTEDDIDRLQQEYEEIRNDWYAEP